MTNYTDQFLIEQLKSSDSTRVDHILRYIFQNYQKSILALLRSKSASLEDAQEIFNESVFALVKNAKKGLLDRSDAQVKPYLIAICKKKLSTKRNGKGFVIDIDSANANDIPIADDNQLAFLVSEERRSLIQNLLEQVGKDCQTILLSFYYHKEKMQEIAKKMHYANEQVARNKKVKCMKRLKDLILKSPFYKEELKL